MNIKNAVLAVIASGGIAIIGVGAAIAHGTAGGAGHGMMQGRGFGTMFGRRVSPMLNFSVDGVRNYLSWRIEQSGNKRLKVGEVKADKGSVTADIATVDDSLVQRLKVDQRTGVITYDN